MRVRTGFTGTDTINLLEIKDENLAIADLAGSGRLLDRFDDLIQHVILDGNFELDLGQEIDDILGTAVELGVTFLTSKTLHFGNRDPLHANGGESLTHLEIGRAHV